MTPIWGKPEYPADVNSCVKSGSCIRSYSTFFFYQNLHTQCNAYPLLDLNKNQYIRFIEGTNKNTIECKILEIASICRRRMFVEKKMCCCCITLFQCMGLTSTFSEMLETFIQHTIQKWCV